MTAADQPTIFPGSVLVAVSSVEDGSMKDGVELMTPAAVQSRTKFLERLHVPPEQAAVHFADFTTDDFCVYKEASPGLMPGADAVSTRQAQRPILLPLADCVGAVLYDPTRHALMVSHLGRHSTEQFGGRKSVEHMAEQYGSRPEELLVWLSPSPGVAEYPLWAFDGRSFVDVLTEQLQEAGVNASNIEASPVDTATNPHYFSHSQYLKGRQSTDGRYAIVAMLK